MSFGVKFSKKSIKMCNIRQDLIVILVIMLNPFCVHCKNEVHQPDDLFSAVASLENLLITQEALVTSLQSYIFSQEKNLDTIKNYMNSLRVQNDVAYRKKHKFLANPINAFLLIKRLSIDWSQILQLIAQSSTELIQMSSMEQFIYPTSEDFQGACDGIGRLIDTYQLDVKSLARGEIYNMKGTEEMTAGDCLALGTYSYHKNEFNQSKQWLEEALIRAKREVIPTAQKEFIFEYLALSYGQLGNSKLALHNIKELLKINPTHKPAKSLKEHFQFQVSNSQNVDVFTRYKELCRGEDQIDVRIKSKLNCYYHKPSENKFLTIAPFKVEEAYHSPQILIFHDVLSKSEINMLKYFAKPNLRRAQVVSGDESAATPNRIGKSAWLDSFNFPHVQPINSRISDMTGLSMNTSEVLQVLNYGIGGHYDIHHDYEQMDASEYLKNRIATLNDVTLGGATVFPKLGLTLWPKRGSAAFWYNLHSDLQVDDRTMHAACPVLMGSKWVCNKWIHDPAQIFRKPCGLKPSTIGRKRNYY